MDFVPKETRARWKSLDSISQFGWCGSAAPGGWLADKYSYGARLLHHRRRPGRRHRDAVGAHLHRPRSEAAAKSSAAPAEEATIRVRVCTCCRVCAVGVCFKKPALPRAAP